LPTSDRHKLEIIKLLFPACACQPKRGKGRALRALLWFPGAILRSFFLRRRGKLLGPFSQDGRKEYGRKEEASARRYGMRQKPGRRDPFICL